MRAILLGAMCFTISLVPAISGAAAFDYGPNASMYVSYAFDASAEARADTGLRYGLRMDHDWRQRLEHDAPALFEWQFDSAGFDHIAVSGTPVLNSEIVLRQDDEGGIGSYLANNLGSIILYGGGALLVFAIIDASSDENDRELDEVDDPPGAGTVDNSNP